MNQKEAKSAGYNRGKGIVEAMEDLPADYDLALDELYASEENSRQYSPFEFTAYELNAGKYPDELWATFEEGITEAFEDALEEIIG